MAVRIAAHPEQDSRGPGGYQVLHGRRRLRIRHPSKTVEAGAHALRCDVVAIAPVRVSTAKCAIRFPTPPGSLSHGVSGPLPTSHVPPLSGEVHWLSEPERLSRTCHSIYPENRARAEIARRACGMCLVEPEGLPFGQDCGRLRRGFGRS
jgi:hypothetical protein